jgi:hypothetical protein
MSQIPSYLRYLPAVYSTTSPAFLTQYLQIFQKILTGIPDSELDGRKGIAELLAAPVIGNLFYPRLSFLFPPSDTEFIPPISGTGSSTDNANETQLLTELNTYIGVPDTTDLMSGYSHVAQSAQTDPLAGITGWLNAFLVWLGGWVDLAVDNSWSIDKKRTVIAEIMALYRLRGTPQGMSMMINLLLDLPVTMTGVTYGTNNQQTSITGQMSVTVSNPTVPAIPVNSQASKGFMLQSAYQAGSPVVSGYLPWLFVVQLLLPNAYNSNYILTSQNVQQIQSVLTQLRQLLPRIKPAGSRFEIQLIPSMQLQASGYASQLGSNTLLGEQGITT